MLNIYIKKPRLLASYNCMELLEGSTCSLPCKKKHSSGPREVAAFMPAIRQMGGSKQFPLSLFVENTQTSTCSYTPLIMESNLGLPVLLVTHPTCSHPTTQLNSTGQYRPVAVDTLAHTTPHLEVHR